MIGISAAAPRRNTDRQLSIVDAARTARVEGGGRQILSDHTTPGEVWRRIMGSEGGILTHLVANE